MKKIIPFLITLFFINSMSYCDAFDFKKMNPFKKKPPKEKIKMVETKEEWEIEAQSIPIDLRGNKNPEPPKEENYYYPKPRYIFQKYNYPQGTRTHNISEIKNKLIKTPTIVADKDCHYVAYTQYYFSPNSNQISSNFFVEKLEGNGTKTKKILNYNHKSKERFPIVESGTKTEYKNLFNALVLVDWSQDSKKLLIRENIGSMYGGIYKTNLIVHILGDEINHSKTIKLTNFENLIKNYYQNYENLQLSKYSYTFEPLGFSADNDNIIVTLLYVYNNQKEKVFLGTWGYNIERKETILISKNNPVQEISSNGLILKRTLNN